MKENNKTYNATDFASYHAGTMPVHEMHALEKAALEDPFLADALDGYEYSVDPQRELVDITGLLNERRNQKKIFSLTTLSANTWWRIAAMFIVIAGAGYFFYQANISKIEQSIATNETVIGKEEERILAQVYEDTSSPSSVENLASVQSADKNKSPATKVLPQSSQSTESKNAEREALQQMAQTEMSKKSEISAMRAAAQDALTKNAEALQESESGERSFLQSPDSAGNIFIHGTLRQEDSLLKIKADQNSMNEVVAYGTEKNRKFTQPAVKSANPQGALSKSAPVLSTPYVTGGKEKLDQYIRENMSGFLDSAGITTFNITLTFTLNEEYKPSQIKVLQSTCIICNPVVIKLLKEGPVWIGTPGALGKVSFSL